MTALTALVGALLTVVGVLALVMSGAASWTALIPSAVGLILFVLALIARNRRVHRRAVHAALLVAVLGAAGSVMNVLKLGDLFAGTAERRTAVITSASMLVVLLIYVGIGVRSFIVARRYRARLAAQK